MEENKENFFIHYDLGIDCESNLVMDKLYELYKANVKINWNELYIDKNFLMHNSNANMLSLLVRLKFHETHTFIWEIWDVERLKTGIREGDGFLLCLYIHAPKRIWNELANNEDLIPPMSDKFTFMIANGIFKFGEVKAGIYLDFLVNILRSTRKELRRDPTKK